jgi:hypothetical protein
LVLCQPQVRRDGLDRLAQAHVVGQARPDLETEGAAQPRRAVALVLTQGGVQPSGRLEREEPRRQPQLFDGARLGVADHVRAAGRVPDEPGRPAGDGHGGFAGGDLARTAAHRPRRCRPAR